MTKKELTLRDHLALDRTYLANQRTFLAYFRSAIMIFVSGITVLKLFPSETSLKITGIIFIPVAGIVMILGIISYFTMNRKIIEARKESD